MLKTDAIINLILGVLLMAFPTGLVKALGIPPAASSFYPTLIGSILFGIGLALLFGCYGKSSRFNGLGLGGAIAINLCGGLVLTVWLLSGALKLSLRGQLLLWLLVLLLIGLSLLEGLAYLQDDATNP